MSPEQKKRYAELSMFLPEGKTCANCYWLLRCTMLFNVNPNNTHCDFAPSRFANRNGEVRP